MLRYKFINYYRKRYNPGMLNGHILHKLGSAATTGFILLLSSILHTKR